LFGATGRLGSPSPSAGTQRALQRTPAKFYAHSASGPGPSARRGCGCRGLAEARPWLGGGGHTKNRPRCRGSSRKASWFCDGYPSPQILQARWRGYATSGVFTLGAHGSWAEACYRAAIDGRERFATPSVLTGKRKRPTWCWPVFECPDLRKDRSTGRNPRSSWEQKSETTIRCPDTGALAK
jgi:hypothetical protein